MVSCNSYRHSTAGAVERAKHGFNPDNLPEPEKCETKNSVPTPP